MTENNSTAMTGEESDTGLDDTTFRDITADLAVKSRGLADEISMCSFEHDTDKLNRSELDSRVEDILIQLSLLVEDYQRARIVWDGKMEDNDEPSFALAHTAKQYLDDTEERIVFANSLLSAIAATNRQKQVGSWIKWIVVLVILVAIAVLGFNS